MASIPTLATHHGLLPTAVTKGWITNRLRDCSHPPPPTTDRDDDSVRPVMDVPPCAVPAADSGTDDLPNHDSIVVATLARVGSTVVPF